MTRDQVIRLLGTIPTDPWGHSMNLEHECNTCGVTFTERSLAWGEVDYAPDMGVDVPCISCALQAELDREAEDER